MNAMSRCGVRRLAGVAAAGMLASAAGATWSIILIDLRTGEIAVGSATCLTGFDLQVNTPVLVTGLGAATAQSFVDQTGRNRVFIRDGLLAGQTTDEILAGLAVFDPGHQTRQYGIADVFGHATTFSGSGAGAWAGGRTGRFTSTHAGQTSEIAYAIQGNVLTGSPVVDQAVEAVINTPGDLAEKLMAGMQAARLQGGDGRCSCNQGPTGCGVPPIGWDPDTGKSAHIAYMLVSRTGDVDGCLGLYAFGDGANAVSTGDWNGDGAREVYVAGVSQLVRVENSTAAGAPFVTLGGGVQVGMLPATCRRLEMGDVTGDGLLDAVACSSSSGAVYVLPGRADGTFEPARTFTVGGAPLVLKLADLNGDAVPDILSTSAGGGLGVLLRSDGAGGHTLTTLNAGTNVPGIEAIDLDTDGDLDVVLASTPGDELLTFVQDASGDFAPGASISVGDEPQDVLRADFDLDGAPDLVVANRAARTLTFLRKDGAGFSSSSLALAAPPRRLHAARVNGDPHPAIFVQNAPASNFSLAVPEGGGYIADGLFQLMGVSDTALADLNADGLDDVVGSAISQVVVSTASGDARLPYVRGAGCGAGDYFMTFNVAGQQQSDPDPVVQLQGLIDGWRTALVGQPDAVTSAASFAQASAPGNGHAVRTLHITLRDWQTSAVPGAWGFALAAADGSDVDVSLEGATDLGGGVYDLAVRVGPGIGEARVNVTVLGGVRPVTLMPPVRLRVRDGRADVNTDGEIDIDDLFAYLDLFVAGDGAADFTGSSEPGDSAYGVRDGTLDAADFFYLLDMMAG